MSLIQAEPFPLEFDAATTALVIIDMQRDFVLPGGFGEKLRNDTSLLLAAVEPTKQVLDKARKKGILVIHTREGHRPDLTDCPPAKLTRGGKTFIGTPGPMGRILVRGEQGHDIIHQLSPIAGEPMIALHFLLQNIRHPSRCHRIMVAGRTLTTASRQSNSIVHAARLTRVA